VQHRAAPAAAHRTQAATGPRRHLRSAVPERQITCSAESSPGLLSASHDRSAGCTLQHNPAVSTCQSAMASLESEKLKGQWCMSELPDHMDERIQELTAEGDALAGCNWESFPASATRAVPTGAR
jgi:hypothetical protein